MNKGKWKKFIGYSSRQPSALAAEGVKLCENCTGCALFRVAKFRT